MVPVTAQFGQIQESPDAFQFGGAFIGRADCESALERRLDYESALGSPASEPDSQSGGFYNACPHFEPHPNHHGDEKWF
jgi:hypothetical protein